MNCKNCGNSLNEGEVFCGNCGVSVNNEEVNLVISRPGKVMGCAVQLHIDLDGASYDLGAGQDIKLTLGKGAHVIKYKVWCRSEHEVTVNIEDNKVCQVIFSYDALLGGFKVSKKSVL